MIWTCANNVKKQIAQEDGIGSGNYQTEKKIDTPRATWGDEVIEEMRTRRLEEND